MPKQNPFRNDTFADLWAKADYVKRLVDEGATKHQPDQEVINAIQGVVGDLYQAIEDKFGDKRIKKIVEFSFREPSMVERLQ